jgi:hypothetical protein
MKPIATWSFEPWFRKSRWNRTDLMVASMRASILNIDEFFGKPTVYADTLTRDVIDYLGLNCDVVVGYDNIYEKDGIDKEFWMYTKLLTYQQQKESFFHFDFDFILFRALPEDFFDGDLGFQHIEKQSDGITYLSNTDYQIYLPDIFYRYDLEEVSYPNLGFLYFKDMNFNEEYCRIAIETVKKNSSENVIIPQKPLSINCIIEQQLLGLLIKEKKVNYKVFVEGESFTSRPNYQSLYNECFHHYVGKHKNGPIAEKYLNSYINKDVVTVSKYLQHLKSQRKD